MGGMISSPYVALALGAVIIHTVRYFFNLASRPPYPPGPKGLPIIGNLYQLPTENEWLTYAAWADNFGDIVSVNTLGTTIVILNSSKVAIDLLEKRGQIYSGRPKLVMLGELMGWNDTLGLNSRSESFKEYRRLLHRFMGTKVAVQQFAPLQEHESRNLLRLVLRDPEHMQENIRRTAGAIIMMMAYGYKIEANDDPFLKIVNKANSEFAIAWQPGSFLVDQLPFLKHIPDWFPGAEFKRIAATSRKTLAEMADMPFDLTKNALTVGTAVPCYTANLLESMTGIKPEEEHNIRWSAASLYSGGSDTTVSAMHSFVLAMVLYPDVQKRAQEEVDAVVGTDRLPSFNDRPRLPYIEAMMQEVLRWNPVTPLGVPHRLMQDDVYNGYFIPKDAIIIVNTWRSLHDPKVYPQPAEFIPERFLAESGRTPQPDVRPIAFGHGRRTCPGVHVADSSLFIQMAMFIAAFDFRKAVIDGKEVTPPVRFTSGPISFPEPFPCSITPRSTKAEALILAES